MKVYVKQRKITLFGNKYIVYKDDRELYVVRRILLSIKRKYEISQYYTGQTIGTIENGLLSFKANATVSIPSGKYKVVQKSFNSLKFKCRNQDSSHSEIEMKGSKGYSGNIYENSKQIGRWNKNKFIVFHGDAFEMVLDYDVDLELMIALMVIVDMFRIQIKIGGEIGWDTGNIARGLERGNTVWRPKEKGKNQ